MKLKKRLLLENINVSAIFTHTKYQKLDMGTLSDFILPFYYKDTETNHRSESQKT